MLKVKIMKTVLSIEDNFSTQNDIRNAVTKKFNFVSIKDNFDEIAANDILKINPDLILLDIQLCGRDDKTGIEIARRLRQNNTEVPIIMFSLNGEYRELLLREKLCNTFIQKPCDIEQILAEIEDFLPLC
jgi:DNA-binding response OmpR family regulator